MKIIKWEFKSRLLFFKHYNLSISYMKSRTVRLLFESFPRMQICAFFITRDQRSKNVLLYDTKHKKHPNIPPNLIKHIVCIPRPFWFDMKHALRQQTKTEAAHETRCSNFFGLSNCRYLSSVSSRIIFPWRRASNQLWDSGEPSLLKDVCLFLCHHLYVCGRHRQCNRIPRFRFAESVCKYIMWWWF